MDLVKRDMYIILYNCGLVYPVIQCAMPHVMAQIWRRILDLDFEFDKKPCDTRKPCDNCQLSHGFLSNSKSKSKLGHCCTIMLYHSQQLSEVLMMALWHFWLVGRKDAGSPQSTSLVATLPTRSPGSSQHPSFRLVNVPQCYYPTPALRAVVG